MSERHVSSLAKWSAVMREFNNSGLSAMEFSRLNSININTFYGWRSRLKKLSSPDADESFRKLSFSSSDISPPHGSSGVLIHIADMFTVSVNSGFDETEPAKILKVLSRPV